MEAKVFKDKYIRKWVASTTMHKDKEGDQQRGKGSKPLNQVKPAENLIRIKIKISKFSRDKFRASASPSFT